MKVERSLLVILCVLLFGFTSFVSGQSVVHISIPDRLEAIDPMIYGQMLEDCNDSVIYGGLIRGDGTEHPVVNELLKPLNMPIVRWPAGTYIHEYNWENGIGPKESRPNNNTHSITNKLLSTFIFLFLNYSTFLNCFISPNRPTRRETNI
jgi:alpha-L-arabinofuranosidase